MQVLDSFSPERWVAPDACGSDDFSESHSWVISFSVAPLKIEL